MSKVIDANNGTKFLKDYKMRFSKSILIVAVIITAFIFATGCEKLSDKELSDKNEVVTDNNSDNGIVFQNVKWKPVVAKNDVDIYGLKGNLYVNANNKSQALFEFTAEDNLGNPIVESSDPLYAKECDNATGSYENQTIDGQTYVACRGDAKDCWWELRPILKTDYVALIIHKCPKE